jgi:peptide/nickel transport system permease protein
MMLIFVLRRVAWALVTVLIASWIAFVLVHLSGSTPGGITLGQSATAEQVYAYNESIGWYDPWIQQFLAWVWQVLQGNLGVSLIDGRPIGPDIAKRLPVTAALALGGTLPSASLRRCGAERRIVASRSSLASCSLCRRSGSASC